MSTFLAALYLLTQRCQHAQTRSDVSPILAILRVATIAHGVPSQEGLVHRRA